MSETQKIEVTHRLARNGLDLYHQNLTAMAEILGRHIARGLAACGFLVGAGILGAALVLH